MPATGTETVDALVVIIAQLAADAQVGTSGTYGILGWHKDIAELTPPVPVDAIYGIVGWQGGTRVTYPGPVFIALNGLVMVKLVGPTGKFTSVIKPAYRRVYTLLDGSASSNADLTMFGKLYQEEPIDYTETPVGAPKISHLGGLWRILAG